MTWYRGPTLLDKLETVDVTPRAANQAFRMAVQWVSRPTADFRGYCGLIAGGEVRPGMDIIVQPSGQRTTHRPDHYRQRRVASAPASANR